MPRKSKMKKMKQAFAKEVLEVYKYFRCCGGLTNSKLTEQEIFAYKFLFFIKGMPLRKELISEFSFGNFIRWKRFKNKLEKADTALMESFYKFYNKKGEFT